MIEDWNNLMGWLQVHQVIFSLVDIILLVLAAGTANWVIKRVLVRGLHKMMRSAAVGQAIAGFCEKELGWHIRFQEDPVYGNCLAAGRRYARRIPHSASCCHTGG